MTLSVILLSLFTLLLFFHFLSVRTSWFMVSLKSLLIHFTFAKVLIIGTSPNLSENFNEFKPLNLYPPSNIKMSRIF